MLLACGSHHRTYPSFDHVCIAETTADFLALHVAGDLESLAVLDLGSACAVHGILGSPVVGPAFAKVRSYAAVVVSASVAVLFALVVLMVAGKDLLPAADHAMQSTSTWLW
jgi:hypothetical protein